jgi:discoidin domain receptor family protein 2
MMASYKCIYRAKNIFDFGSLFYRYLSINRCLYTVILLSVTTCVSISHRYTCFLSSNQGKFSCKSDVWSFAVTLWEVLTFARERPYDNHSNEQVLDNCGHYYRGNGQHLALSQPPNCPKEIYDLMVECCHRDEALRPTFREIHMFLSRKNMGYDPHSEQPMRFALGYDV